MFKPTRFAVLLAGVTLAVSVMAQPAPDDGPDRDQDQSSQGQTADPPTRVARLAFIRGDVSFVPAGENDWVEAQLNRPLITGDKLWTDRNSRTELEIGSSTIRMDQNSSFDFLNLDDKTAQIELTQGTLSLRVRRLYDNQTYEIDTPTLAFVVNRVGEYRVTVEPNGQATTVAVLQGGGDTYGEGNARFRVEEGQSVTFNDAQLQNYQSNALPPPDDFDNFSHERDRRWDNAKSRQYVSEDVIGYQDLDDNGDWDDVAEYGHVWYPTTVAVGWSPYHSGHWGWVGSYGWSWVDDAPWGFAPFHYGRWAYIGNRWGWCPGRIDVRPVYAPALVAFVGGGVGVSIGFGSGPVGWFPLGYNDVYYPSYRVSRGYFGRVNSFGGRGGGNTTIINNYYGNYSRGNVNYGQINYANRNVAGAITAVPAAAFVGARPVGSNAIAVNRETFANGRVSGFAAVAPTRASIAPATAARSLPPAAVTNRQIVAATRPPAPVASFAQRQTLLQKNPGQPLRENQMHIAATAVTATGPARGAVGARQNVRVVTTAGAPVRTAAPPLPARTGPVGMQNNAAAANGRVTPTTGAAGVTRVGPGNPAVQPTNRANISPRENAAATNASPTGAGRPAANAHLDSSRFAHPGANTATPTTTAVAPNRSTTGQGALPAVQNSNPQNNNLRAGRNVGGDTVSGANAHNVGTTGQGKPEYHQASPVNRNAQQDYRAPQGNNNNQRPTAQEYRGQTNNPRPAAQEYHAPQSNNVQHNNPQESQHAAPASQMMMPQQHSAPPAQIQQQRVAPPPPPQMRAQPQPARTPPPPKDKKDDDKKHGGR
jgi:FecR protein